MNQDDIHSLLLILLLMSNERENADNFAQTARGALNEIILTAMLLNSRNPTDTVGDGDSQRRCPDAVRNNTDTTF